MRLTQNRDAKSNRQEYYNSYYNYIPYFQDGRRKIDTLNREMERVKRLKSHFNDVLNHTKQSLRIKINTRCDLTTE